jgi:hypothetical protein
MSSSIFKKIEVVFRFPKKLGSSSIFKKIEVVFHFQKNEVVFHLKKMEVVFHLPQKVRSSSIFSLPAVKLTKYSFFDTPTGGWAVGWVGGRLAGWVAGWVAELSWDIQLT